MTHQEQNVKTLTRFLDPGCLQPYLDKFTSKLAADGYTPLSISNYLQSVAHFGSWIHNKGIVLGHINEDVIVAFDNHRCMCPGGRRHKRLSRRYVARVRRFIRYLSQQGIVDRVQEKAKEARPSSVVEFSEWMVRHRGISTRTVDRYERLLVSLLPVLGDDPAHYTAAEIRQAITSKAHPRYSRATVQGYATALRVYLRFLAFQGRCRADLEAAVPTLPQWRLSALPRYLGAEEVEQVIASCDRHTSCRLRDAAILLLLSRLGLRAGDIVNMRLDDIDWGEATLRVRGKGRWEVRLPLPQDAGEAVLAYVERARPAVPIDRMFLCMSAPYRALPSSVVVSHIVRAALARAGIVNPPSRGANLLRHSAATSMLRAGATLETISTVLRHRSVDTTAHYAKVDIPMLQPIAQPWPGSVSC